MGLFCEVATALHLTFGALCRPAPAALPPSLPENDAAVWETPAPPMPAPPAAPRVPAFPPVIIREAAPAAPRPAPAPQPPPPNPYRLALEAAFAAPAPQNPDVAALGSLGTEPFRPPALTPPALRSGPGGWPLRDAYAGDGRISGFPVDNGRILAADRYIAGIMETGFDSRVDCEAGGAAIVQTARDVFGYHGRNVLIPKGSRLLCGCGTPERTGETRAVFACRRILIAGHRAEILQLSAPVGDQQGRGGVAGTVDERFWERYGTAFLLAGVSGAVRLASAAADSDSDSDRLSEIADRGSEELSQKLGDITAAVLERTVDLRPIVRIAQGKRVQIRPRRDWDIRKPGNTK